MRHTLDGNILTSDGWIRGRLETSHGRITQISGDPVDPTQNDAAVREKEKRAKALFADVVAAYEGLVIEV